MRYLTLSEVLELHRLAIELTGGGAGVRDLAGVESAVVQPQMTFGGDELYPTLIDKAAALLFFAGAESPIRRWKQTNWARGDGDLPHTQRPTARRRCG